MNQYIYICQDDHEKSFLSSAFTAKKVDSYR